MNKSRLLGAVCACIFVLISASAQAAFNGRLPATPGGADYQAYYDDQLDITWIANANVNGLITDPEKSQWLLGLNINGVTGWRTPSMDVNGDSFPGDSTNPPFDGVVDCATSTQAACKDNEFGHLYYYGAGTTFGIARAL